MQCGAGKYVYVLWFSSDGLNVTLAGTKIKKNNDNNMQTDMCRYTKQQKVSRNSESTAQHVVSHQVRSLLLNGFQGNKQVKTLKAPGRIDCRLFLGKNRQERTRKALIYFKQQQEREQ